MSEEKKPYLGVKRVSVQGTPISNEFTKRWLDKIDHWDGTMPETQEEELERLRAENAALREIVQVVAHASLGEMEQLIHSCEWQDKARAALGEPNP